MAEDPSFVPYVGGFWSHDDRYRSDALKPTTDDKDQSSSTPRFVSPQQPAEAPPPQQRRRYPNRNVRRKVPEEVLNQRWGHDGYEELMRMEELEEREGRKFSTLDEYYRSKRHGGNNNKQQYQSRNRRMKAGIPDGAGASSQWQQAETMVESFDQQWPTLGTTEKEDTAANKEWESTTHEDKENEQWNSTAAATKEDEGWGLTATATKGDEGWGSAATTTKEDEGWGSATAAAKEDEGWGSTTTTKKDEGWGSAASTKKDEGWSNIEQPQTTGWDPTNAAAEWKQQLDTKQRNGKGQQSKSKQPMSRGTSDTKKRPPASKKPVVSNEKAEEEVEWKALASWDTKKVSNDVNWKSDAIAQEKNIKTNGDDSWNASLPWEEENGAKSTTDSGWGDANNQAADGDDGWKKAADWGQSTGGWASTTSVTTNGWGDASSASNKADGWRSNSSGSWRNTENKEREQRRGRGYLSQKKPLEPTTTKSKPMSKHAKPFSPSQPINTTPTLPSAAASEPTSAPENTSSVYAFATEPWQSSGSPRDDARGHERFIEDQEDQESDVEIILEADTSASASRSEVDTATPPRQRDLEGNWRRRDQQGPVVDEGDSGKDDMMASHAAAAAAAQAAAMQQGIPYFYPPAMGGYMPMPPYPIPMPMTSAPAGVPPSAMMPVVTSAALTDAAGAAPSPPNATSTPPNGTSTESPDNGSYMPSSFEANGMVYYSVNPSAMYPYYYYPAPMAMPMMAAPPPSQQPPGADSPHQQQGTDNSADDGWGPEPDHSAQDSGWEPDKNTQQASFNPPFHYYPSYS